MNRKPTYRFFMTIIITTFLSTIVMMPATVTAVGFSNWQCSGPGGGGRMDCAGYDPDPTNQKVFLGVDIGGMYKSEDNGESWTCIMTDLAYQNAPYYAWKCRGDVSCSPHSEIVLVGTNGGCIRSTNGGNNWDWIQKSWDGLYMGIHTFVWDPTSYVDHEIVLAGAGNFDGSGARFYQIARSLDGGENWSSVGDLGAVDDQRISVFSLVRDPHPDRSNIVYASTTYGVYRCADPLGINWGAYWDRIGTETDFPIPIDRLRKMTASTSGGSTDATYLYLTATRGDGSEPYASIFRSNDGGETWDRIAHIHASEIGAGEANYFRHIACKPDEPDLVVAGIYGGSTPRAVWRSMNATSPNPQFECIAYRDELKQQQWMASGLGFNAHHLAVDPNSNRMIFGGYRTEDWTASNPDDVDWIDFLSIPESIPPEQRVYWQGTGIEPTAIFDIDSNLGELWMAQADNRVWRKESEEPWGWPDYWEIVHNPLLPGGGNWNYPWGLNSFGVDGINIEMNPNNTYQLFATTAHIPASSEYSFFDNCYDSTGAVLHLQDYGQSGNTGWELWGDLSNSSWGVTPRMAIDWQHSRIHVAAHGSGYWRGSTNTAGFSRINYLPDPYDEGYCLAVEWLWMSREINPKPRSQRRILIGHSTYNRRTYEETGGIWFSNDEGNTWQQGTLIQEPSSPSMDGLDVLCFEHIPGSPIVLAGCWDQCCGNGYGIVKSIDGGQTWESTGFLDGLYYTDPPARVTSIISHPVYRNILFAAAAIPEVYTIGDAKADIWISNDYGSNWIPCDINGIGSKRINCLEIDPIYPDYIYAGTGGSGLWMANITLSTMDRETTALAQIPSQYSDELNVFPLHYSPISQRQYFKLNIPLRADPLPVAFEIFDLSGRKVDSVLPRIFTPGSHMIEWSSHGVASGTYLCRLNTPENRAMVKFVIIK